jgi:hypothetical protein
MTSEDEESEIRSQTRSLRASREHRIRQFEELQRQTWEWINFGQLREWYRNPTGRPSLDAEKALRDAVLKGDSHQKGPELCF